VTHFLTGFLALLTLAGCIYTLGAIVCLVRYARRPDAWPTSFPAVSVLKPLHGDEPRLFDNLASFLAQDYRGPIRFVFGVSDPADAAVAAIDRLKQAFPQADLQFVADPQRHGRNGKVSNLVNMSREIAGEVVVLADSDMLVDPDYLTRVVGALEQPGVGAVSCLYRGISLPSFWSRLATGWVDTSFLPNLIVGVTLGLAHPCMGSTIALRRQTLDRIGGFAAFAGHLADDYEIGAAVRRLGLKVVVPARPVLGHTSAATSLSALLRQELRWARTIKTVDFGGFAGSLVTHVVPLALLTAALDGFRTRDWLLLVLVALLRFSLIMQVKRFVRKDTADLSLVLLRDLLSFAVFIGSFWPGSIEWRGHRFGVRSDGLLTTRDNTGR
jgi:ceramide glucosyltransferase